MRLFYGIPIPKDVREELCEMQRELKASGTPMKLVEPENLHITLAFIGETGDVDKYKKALDSVPKGAFDISLSRIGAFPHEDNARVVWVDVEPEENIINIHRVISTQIGSQEKDYKPHITLARLKGVPDNVVKQMLAKKLSTPLKVDRVQLLKSILSSKGPKYEVVHEVRL